MNNEQNNPTVIVSADASGHTETRDFLELVELHAELREIDDDHDILDNARKSALENGDFKLYELTKEATAAHCKATNCVLNYQEFAQSPNDHQLRAYIVWRLADAVRDLAFAMTHAVTYPHEWDGDENNDIEEMETSHLSGEMKAVYDDLNNISSEAHNILVPTVHGKLKKELSEWVDVRDFDWDALNRRLEAEEQAEMEAEMEAQGGENTH